MVSCFESNRSVFFGTSTGDNWSLYSYVVFQLTGYSGSDLKALCQEAAMLPIRELGGLVSTVKKSEVLKSVFHVQSAVTEC